MYSVLNCRNVAKHTDVRLGYLRFNVTSTDNAGYFKTVFTMVFQTLLYTLNDGEFKCEHFRNSRHIVTF
jgi:hypothetical protein